MRVPHNRVVTIAAVATAMVALAITAITVRHGRREHAIESEAQRMREGGGGDKRAAAGRLANLGPAAVPVLIELLGDPDGATREAAAMALRRIGPRAAAAVPALLAMLRSDEGAEFAAAVRTLGKIGEPALPALMQALEEEPEPVRTRAIWAIAHMGEDAAPAKGALQACLASPDEGVREASAVALGAIGQAARDVWPDLANLLNDELPGVRLAAMLALARIGEPASVPYVADQLGRPEAAAYQQEVMLPPALMPDAYRGLPERPTPEDAIAAFGEVAIPELTQRLCEPAAGYAARSALERIGPAAVAAASDALAAGLVHDDPARCVQAASGLAALGSCSIETCGRLAELLSHTEARVRAAAAGALGAAGAPAQVAVDLLVRVALEDPEAAVRQQAAGAVARMGETGESALLQAVGRALESQDTTTCLRAAEAAGASRTVARQLWGKLATALGHKDPAVRVAAVRAIRRCGRDAATLADELRGLLADPDESVRIEAAEVLAREGEAPVEVLATLLRSSDQSIVGRALGALNELGPAAKDAAPEIARLLSVPKYARQAAAVLRNIGPVAEKHVPPYLDGGDELARDAAPQENAAWREGGGAAVPSLMRLLRSGDRRLQQDAAFALGEIGGPAASALPELRALAGSGDPGLRSVCLEAIRRIESAAR